MKIIGLHGLPRSGKDTVAKILIDAYGYERIAFAEPLKKAAAVLLDRPMCECNGLTESGEVYDREAVMPEWGFSMRWFLQTFGTECLRQQIREDFWTKRLVAEVQKRPLGSLIVVTDVRFANETNALRNLGGLIVQVRRPGLVGSNHISDRPVICDWTIDNDGTLEDLKLKVLSEVRL